MANFYVPLDTHSEYSIVDSTVRIPAYVDKAASYQMPCIALTDEMNIFGLVKFYKAAVSRGIKPILGADIRYSVDHKTYKMTLLCKNELGYQHLKQLISAAYTEATSADGAIVVDFELIKRCHGGLIALMGVQSDIGWALCNENQEQALIRARYWHQLFGDSLYLSVQKIQQADELQYIQNLRALVSKLSIPVVATNAIRFIEKDDYKAHQARVCIAEGRVLNDPRRIEQYSQEQYFKSPLQMQALFSSMPGALENSVIIAQRCTVRLDLGQVCLPNFPTPNQQSVADYFEDVSMQGLEARLLSLNITVPDERAMYIKRLNDELRVINQMGFAGYFLIVADFIAWSKQHDIPVGPGRGSGAGSLVAYALGITDLDPIHHGLLFERFLNPERVSMPDFDIDFCMEGRDRVIEYVSGRYGASAVAQIITFGTMAAKAVVRDVGRVLGMPYGFVDAVAKLIPFEIGMTLSKALVQEQALADRYQSEPELQGLIDLALKLEGLTRNAGKHAGGVVIAPSQLIDFTALYCVEPGDAPVTQFDKDDVESTGLIKFDFLGLRTLTIISWTLKTVNRVRKKNGESPFLIDNLPLDDEGTFALLKNCETTAVFQLESRGMKELIRRLQPDSFEEITALVALFRPGPLQSGMVDDFIDRKHGRAKVTYLHPMLAPILSSTYGVILYQEQVMQIAQELSGYTLGGADILRRAMGKKKPEEMARQRDSFVAGAQDNGVDPTIAAQIFDLIEKFAGYGFNKSHSAAYALIAYQTAWLKAHYPAEFMAAVLSSDMDNTDKVVAFLQEAKQMGLVVCPPQINQGFYQFTVDEKGALIYGLGAIKGVGAALAEEIAALRERDGPYHNMFEFAQRLGARKLTRRTLDPLIKAGCFDEWSIDRAALYASIDASLKYASQQHRDESHGQGDMFTGAGVLEGARNISYTAAKEWSQLDRLAYEKEVLGWYVSGHPLSCYRSDLNALSAIPISSLKISGDDVVVLAGMVQSVRIINTRTGKKMAILLLEDNTGSIDVTIFSGVYQQSADLLKIGSVLLVKGAVSEDSYSGGIKCIADAVLSFEHARKRMAKKLQITITSQEKVQQLVDDLPHLIEQHGVGLCTIEVLYEVGEANGVLALGDKFKVAVTQPMLDALSELFGKNALNVMY